MIEVNLHAGWIAIFVGLLFGAVVGMFFHREDWLGGYASWKRRMLRLGHIALLGTGLLNVAFALSVIVLKITPEPRVASVLFLIGAATMPTVCVFSAFWPATRRVFFVPVLSLLAAIADFVYRGLWS